MTAMEWAVNILLYLVGMAVYFLHPWFARNRAWLDACGRRLGYRVGFRFFTWWYGRRRA